MLEAKVFVENRAFPRKPLKVHITYRLITERGELERAFALREKAENAQTENISLGGVYIVTTHALKVGSLLRLYIPLNDDEIVLAPIVEVVWSNGNGGGLRFISMRKEEKGYLSRYLEKISIKKTNEEKVSRRLG